MNRLLNRWTYAGDVALPAQGSGGIAINLGIANRPPGLRLRARVSASGILNAAHRLTLFEGRTITNTIDPERGVHRARQFGDVLPEWLRLKLDMQVDDIFVFHAPGSFTDGGGGTALYSRLGLSARPAEIGPWLLTPDVSGTMPPGQRYYLVQVQNLEAMPVTFSLILDYRFVKP